MYKWPPAPRTRYGLEAPETMQNIHSEQLNTDPFGRDAELLVLHVSLARRMSDTRTASEVHVF